MRRQVRRQLTAPFLGRDFFEAQGPAEHLSDGGYLFALGERFGPGHQVIRTGARAIAQGANRDSRDISFVDRRRGRKRIRPSHYIAGQDLSGPPVPRIRGEHTRTEERPGQSRCLDSPLDFGVQR